MILALSSTGNKKTLFSAFKVIFLGNGYAVGTPARYAAVGAHWYGPPFRPEYHPV
jgi:hypothetical protein